jgi:hypothetical protein
MDHHEEVQENMSVDKRQHLFISRFDKDLLQVVDLYTIEDDAECSICLDEPRKNTRVRELPCGHMYHLNYIKPWFNTGDDSCPYCRKESVVVVVDPPFEI